MAISRASSALLRTRPGAVAAPLRRMQIRKQTSGRDDLGGPGGQQPPPKSPGGPEAVQRNWPLIGGVALVAVGAMAYFGGGSKPSKAEQEADIAKARAQELQNKAAEQLKKFEGKEGGSMGEFSGRKPGMGGFRSE